MRKRKNRQFAANFSGLGKIVVLPTVINPQIRDKILARKIFVEGYMNTINLDEAKIVDSTFKEEEAALIDGESIIERMWTRAWDMNQYYGNDEQPT